MKTIISFFVLNIFAINLASAGFSPATCGVYKTWLEGKSGQQICTEHGGSFCFTVRNKGQGICYGAKASFCSTVLNIGQGICYAEGAPFCSTVANIAQGICYSLGESFCSFKEDKDESEMIAKLKLACKIPETVVNIHD